MVQASPHIEWEINAQTDSEEYPDGYCDICWLIVNGDAVDWVSIEPSESHEPYESVERALLEKHGLPDTTERR